MTYATTHGHSTARRLRGHRRIFKRALDRPDGGRGASREPAPHRRDAARVVERRSLRVDAERGYGLGSTRAHSSPIPHALHPGRRARSRRPSHRAGISHGALGSGPADAGRRRRAQAARVPALRRLRLRSLRRPHAGDDGNDGQPALSQRRRHGLSPAHPLAAHAPGRARHRHLRQGPARHDDGAGRHARSALRARAGRRHAAAEGRRRRRASAEPGRALCPG